MEIQNFPPPSNVAPIRAPSAVGDGDAGPNSPYYRQQRKKRKGPRKEQTEDRPPLIEGSTLHIDIRV